MSPAATDEAPSPAFDRAIVDHVGAAGHADAEVVVTAGFTVVGRHIVAVRDPAVSRGVLLAQARWTLGQIVAEVVKGDAAKGKDRRGT